MAKAGLLERARAAETLLDRVAILAASAWRCSAWLIAAALFICAFGMLVERIGS